MQFEWDENKEHRNVEKHGIDFGTAALVFGDAKRIVKYDGKHSIDEDRYITIGAINGMITVLVVVYTENDKVVRIISARIASKREREEYYNG